MNENDVGSVDSADGSSQSPMDDVDQLIDGLPQNSVARPKQITPESGLRSRPRMTVIIEASGQLRTKTGTNSVASLNSAGATASHLSEIGVRLRSTQKLCSLRQLGRLLRGKINWAGKESPIVGELAMRLRGSMRSGKNSGLRFHTCVGIGSMMDKNRQNWRVQNGPYPWADSQSSSRNPYGFKSDRTSYNSMSRCGEWQGPRSSNPHQANS
ncbi:hypothetical protein O181_026669 [Austropuccinia psidii MF-1]|uniref:Uncharacterized protein n=1 Tax=Austropuccinia psidii MF-1 TaxID=1389203 RepID=A0A9Q3H1U7_9BASI|nr:hypothetical protein [Austropuccinia psidii MF-1]